MKILLDECVPWPMHKILTGHTVSTAQREGWAGITNGQLLQCCEGKFDLFITADQNMQYQQNLQGRSVAILLLSTNKLRKLLAAASVVQSTVIATQPAEFRVLQIP
jgi:hypothetical protein